MKWVRNNIILITILILLSVIAKPVIADSTNDDNDQTNTSGSNTQITGGYTATTTNNNDGQTNTTTTTNTTSNSTTSNGSSIPVNSANSPSFSSMSQDVCSMGVSGSISTLGLGASVGKHVRDLNCERIKLSKVLYDYGMKVAAVSILCQDPRVHAAMQSAGSPCPWDGKIGPAAQEMWDKYPELRPDYEEYLTRAEAISKIDKRILKEEAKELARLEAEAEQKRIEAEKIAEKKAKLEKEKKKKKIIIDVVPTANMHD
jgi:hypothetical protein